MKHVRTHLSAAGAVVALAAAAVLVQQNVGAAQPAAGADIYFDGAGYTSLRYDRVND